MEINKDLVELSSSMYLIFNILLEYFKHSIKDINSYDELPLEVKQIISKETFQYLTKS